MQSLLFNLPSYRSGKIFSAVAPADEHILVERWISHICMCSMAEIILPDPPRSTKASDLVQPDWGKEIFYFLPSCSLSSLLSDNDFVRDYVAEGKLIGLSVGRRVDADDMIAFYPEGPGRSGAALILSLQVDRYLSFGLSDSNEYTKKVRHMLPTNQRTIAPHIISVDLAEAKSKLSSGSKIFDRLVNAAKEKLPPTNLLIALALPEKKAIKFPAGVQAQAKRASNVSKKLKHVSVPKLNADKLRSSEFVEEFYEWLGAVSNRLTTQMLHKDRSGAGGHSLEVDEEIDAIIAHRLKGFFSGALLIRYLARLRHAVSNGVYPWAILNIWGFDDSPLGIYDYCTSSHPQQCSIVVLPEDVLALIAPDVPL